MIAILVSFFTYQEKGITSLIITITGLLSGLFIPLPLLPDGFNRVCRYLPFRLISDLSYRVYSGNIGCSEALFNISMQLILIVLLIMIGRKVMKIALRKVEVQGG